MDPHNSYVTNKQLTRERRKRSVKSNHDRRTHRERSMGLQNDLENKIDFCVKYYGMDWEKVPAGVLINNGVEYWLIKLKKDKVRRLLHQNHGRNGKIVALPCETQNLNAEMAMKYFHTQEWKDGDLKKACYYILNHGKARTKIMERQRAVLAALA